MLVQLLETETFTAENVKWAVRALLVLLLLALLSMSKFAPLSVLVYYSEAAQDFYIKYGKPNGFGIFEYIEWWDKK